MQTFLFTVSAVLLIASLNVLYKVYQLYNRITFRLNITALGLTDDNQLFVEGVSRSLANTQKWINEEQLMFDSRLVRLETAAGVEVPAQDKVARRTKASSNVSAGVTAGFGG